MVYGHVNPKNSDNCYRKNLLTNAKIVPYTVIILPDAWHRENRSLKGGLEMARIRSASEIAEKYARVTPGRSADYAAGVQNPKADWKTATLAAENAWAQGVQQAASEGRFGKGVNRAGTEKWQRKAIELGASRWGPGVSAAKDDYESGFAPYADVIRSTSLPPRGPKGDPRNIERVAKLAMALHAKKISG